MKYINTLDNILPILKQKAFEDKKTIYTVEVKKFRRNKTLNQNSYAWSLITEMAFALNSDINHVYEELLKRYAPSILVGLPLDQDANFYFKHWDKEGIKGEFLIYRAIKGISDMNTYEMSKFINGLVEECKDLEIETLTPSELALLKEE